MKQILHNFKSGDTKLIDVPKPEVIKGHLLIKSCVSLISTGTEKMLVDFGKSNLLGKAKQQPEKVKMVIDKIKTEGLLLTLDNVRKKLDKSIPLGYCNVGEIVDIGSNSSQKFKIGDKVVNNGAHAEFVNVPPNLCAKVPNNVTDEEAAFTVISSVALQGIRLSDPKIGETYAVIGLGLVGLITVQLLAANGCNVIGMDYDKSRLEMAEIFGAKTIDLSKEKSPHVVTNNLTKANGVDAVLITTATDSNAPIKNASLMCKRKGKIILIGTSGLNISRNIFYEKELSFNVSCSYGPGRYDKNYEEKGFDYPFEYVRWTAQRNFEAILELLSKNKVNFKSLITHKFKIDDAEKAYYLFNKKQKSLGILIKYSNNVLPKNNKNILSLYKGKLSSISQKNNTICVGFIGAGNFAGSKLIPAFKKTGIYLKSISSNSGLSGVHLGKKFGIEETTTSTEKLISDKNINTIVISSRHDSHAEYVIKSLKKRKNVFVEKPLCLKKKELEEIIKVYNKVSNDSKFRPMLMVGFNRRFSPLIAKAKSLISEINVPKTFIMTVNSGYIPPNNWTQDKQIGGGRIIGEVCHFIDLLLFLNGYKIVDWNIYSLNDLTKDTVSINLMFGDGSIGTIHYFSNGSNDYQKERLEIFSSGKILQLNNFRNLIGFNWPNFKQKKLWIQNKGHDECIDNFIYSLKNDKISPIPFEDLIEVSKISIDLSEAI